MNLDRIYNVRWAFIKHVAFAWINAVDAVKQKVPADIVSAVAVCFLLICRRFKLEPRDVLTAAGRIINNARDTQPHYVRAIEQYLEEELTDE